MLHSASFSSKKRLIEKLSRLAPCFCAAAVERPHTQRDLLLRMARTAARSTTVVRVSNAAAVRILMLLEVDVEVAPVG